MFSELYGDHYFSQAGGLEETRYVFLAGNGLPARWADRGSFVIAELGFGTGRNILETIRIWREHTSANQELHIYSVEKHPLSREQLQAAHQDMGTPFTDLLSSFLASYHGAGECWQWQPYSNVHLHVDFCDVLQALPSWPVADAWYLDGFAPAKNPAMWSEDVFRLIAAGSREGTTVATYSAAHRVTRGLLANGFKVEKTKGFAGKREMTKAVFKMLS